jgi:hypothetical protein
MLIFLSFPFLWSSSSLAKVSGHVIEQKLLEMKNFKRIKEEDGLAIQGKIEKNLFRTLGVELNKSLLTDLKLGDRPLVRFRAMVNDLGVQRSCFVGSDGVIIGFDSGPLSNPDLTIDSIFISRSPDKIKDKKKCTLNHSINSKTKSDGGFSLQWSRSQIIDKLGLPISESKDRITYIYSSNRVENSTTINVVAFITFQFKDNSMNEFSVSYVESL